MTRVMQLLRNLAAILAAALTLLAAAGAGSCAVTRDALDNGLVVIISPADGSNIVAIEVLVKASAVHEPPGKAGIRQLVQQTLVRGSQSMSGLQFAAALDDIGADFDTGLGLDYVEIYLVCLSRDLGRAMELLAEVVRRPTFPESEVDEQRRIARQHLESLRSEPFEIGQHLVRRGLYDAYPYASPPQGTPESLAAMSRTDLVDFHRRYYLPNSTLICVAGGTAREAALAAVRRCFGDWQPAPLPAEEAPAVPRLEQSVLELREAPVGQAHFTLAYLVGPPRADSYPVMEVLRTLLGQGMGSRLFGALREREAVAYEANAYYFALSGGGYLAAYAAAAPNDLEHTKQLMLGEFERLRREPVSDAELKRAQQFTVGAHALEQQKTKDRAFQTAWHEAIGLGWDFDQRYAEAIQAVTPEQVRQAARAHFTHYCLGLVLPRQ